MKPLAKLSLTRQRLYRKSCIGDNDIPFQETIVPLDLYEDHQGGMYCRYTDKFCTQCAKELQFGSYTLLENFFFTRGCLAGGFSGGRGGHYALTYL